MQSAGYFNYCLNVYWSLSVEEVFYLLLPLTCLTLRRTCIIVLAAMRNITTKAELSHAMRLPWLLAFLCATAFIAMLVSRYVSEPANTALRGWHRRRRATPAHAIGPDAVRMKREA